MYDFYTHSSFAKVADLLNVDQPLRRAIIIEGNPDRDTLGHTPYHKLEKLIQDLGYSTQRVSSADYTDVPDADLAVGFSRGAGRLQWSNAPIKIPIGSHYIDSINNEDDVTELNTPNDFDNLDAKHRAAHGQLSAAMAKAIIARIKEQSLPVTDDTHKFAELLNVDEPQDYQQRVSDRVNTSDPRLLVYHGVGSGKSRAGLIAAETAKANDPDDDYGIVVPASLRDNFKKEVHKYTDSDPPIMSYTGLGMGKNFSHQPSTLILDEVQRMRNPDTALSRATKTVADKAKRILMLSGSPIVNTPGDLAVPLSILSQQDISPDEFTDKFVGQKKVYPGFLASLFSGIKPGEEPYIKNERQLRDLVRGHVDYQPGADPEGVDVNEETIPVPLSSQQQRIQDAVRHQIPTNFLWKLDRDFPLSRQEVKKLTAFMTGLRESSLSTKPFQANPDAYTAYQQSGKLTAAVDKLKQMLQDNNRKKAIVYSNFIDAGLSPYAAALEAEKIPYGMFHGGISEVQRKDNLAQYNAGKLKALLLGPAGAEGISTKGTNLIQILDPYWNETRTHQAQGRGLRFDSHQNLPEDLKNVLIQRYISTSTDPSRIGKLLGYHRELTGDEILQSMAARKENLNEKFRQILRDEGSPEAEATA